MAALAAPVWAEDPGFIEAGEPAECNLPVEAANPPSRAVTATQTKAAEKQKAVSLTPAEQKKQFKARRKLIKKLLKEYRAAPEAEKPAIKAQLTEVVSQGVDAGLAYMKARITAERENLDNWEAKIKEEEANLDAVKAQRVEDLISGEAERKHKAAKKAWKQKIKDAQNSMR